MIATHLEDVYIFTVSRIGDSVLVSERTAEAAECEIVLSSRYFAAETNSKRFLKFVCERYFAEAAHLSEYEIATAALGRRADFDPSHDSIVRVEAHRVRKRLKEYYDHEASARCLHLVIPHGSYLPQFVTVESGTREGSETPVIDRALPLCDEPPPLAITHSRNVLAGAPAVIGVLVLFAISIGIFLVPRFIASNSKAIATPIASTVSTPASLSDVLILAGSSTKGSTNQLGHPWVTDRFFNGGESWSVRYRRILRTADPQLFLSARQGSDFAYDIPLEHGLYELRLYFAETSYGDDNSEGGGESSRMFDVSVNGLVLLKDFDPLSDAGGSNVADVRVFTGLSPAADGKLHLHFRNHWQLKGVAFVNAIQLTRTDSERMSPIRWIAADSAINDRSGRLWSPDQFVQGGRRRELGEEVTNTPDPELYKSERYGHFSYAIPVVSDAKYTLTLYFSEHWFGTPNADGSVVGERLFDVYCNGEVLLRDFDIAKEAGGSLKALTRTFRGLKPDHQGKLLLTFVPNQNYASVTALEVVAESDN